jgi:DNA-directed RNA polymerase III subunit RPC6
MLAYLEPSAEMTGGPWYTDNELDTEFIKILSRACLQFVKDKVSGRFPIALPFSPVSQSFPRPPKPAEDDEDAPPQRLLYAISAAPSYPSAGDVQSFLTRMKLTPTPLTVDHIETLLGVLELDGEIERVPAFGAALWEANAGGRGDDDDKSGDERPAKKRRKDKERDASRKRKRRDVSDSDDDASASEAESSRRKKSGKKKRRNASDDESDSDSEAERRRRKKKRRAAASDSDAGSGSEDEAPRRKKGKKRRAGTPSSDDDSSDSDDARRRRRKRSKSGSKSRARSPSADAGGLTDVFGGSAYVYRALRPERVGTAPPTALLGWASQAPCARCPVFDFCRQGGPVNPQGCEYYEGWLQKGVVQVE